MPKSKKVKLTCFDVANYFISLVDEDEGDYLSNLKLQKLVYYAQGFHLAMYGKPLFNEPIEAWTHGPVIHQLYNHYSSFGAGPIPKPDEVDFSIFNKRTKDLLNEVYVVFGQYSAWKLRGMTHEESPWREAYEQGENTIISHDSLREHFKEFVEE